MSRKFTHWPYVFAFVTCAVVTITPLAVFVVQSLVTVRQTSNADPKLTRANRIDDKPALQTSQTDSGTREALQSEYEQQVPWKDNAPTLSPSNPSPDRPAVKDKETRQPNDRKRDEQQPISETTQPPPIARTKTLKKSANPEPIRSYPPFDDPFWVRLELVDEVRLREDLFEHVTTIDLYGRRESTLAPEQIRATVLGQMEFDHPPDTIFGPGLHPLEQWLDGRRDLEGLPFRLGNHNRLSRNQAKGLDEVSSRLGPRIDAFGNSNEAGSEFNIADIVNSLEIPQDESAIAAMDQLLQPARVFTRLFFIEWVAAIDGGLASDALARRALFDLSLEVRQAAIDALQHRPSNEYYPQLIDGFRHPWPPIARHAAAALVALEAYDAVPSLTDLLDAPDPTKPYRGSDGRWIVKQLVRVNHMRNCFLCHPPSVQEGDLVIGTVPEPGWPVPDRYSARKSDTKVRADITYLKQDFSLVHVTNQHPWPKHQRFDYLVQDRRLTDPEYRENIVKRQMARAELPATSSYPQQRAVQFAQKHLKKESAAKQASKD